MACTGSSNLHGWCGSPFGMVSRAPDLGDTRPRRPMRQALRESSSSFSLHPTSNLHSSTSTRRTAATALTYSGYRSPIRRCLLTRFAINPGGRRGITFRHVTLWLLGFAHIRNGGALGAASGPKKQHHHNLPTEWNKSAVALTNLLLQSVQCIGYIDHCILLLRIHIQIAILFPPPFIKYFFCLHQRCPLTQSLCRLSFCFGSFGYATFY